MGTGSSRTVKRTRQTQVPSPVKQTRPPSSPTGFSKPHTISKRPISSPSSRWLRPTSTHIPSSNSSLEHYATIWEQNGKLSSKFEQMIRSGSSKVEHNQKEVNKQELRTEHSIRYGTAEVESVLTSEVETIHNLTTSERLDFLIKNLKQTHLDFDESVKRRTSQITTETENIIEQIVIETQKAQQLLLIHAKEQQTIEDEQYRILLEDYIKELNEKRAKQLALIQEQLQQQRLTIFNESQLKIQLVTEQANSIKHRIMSEEENKSSHIIDTIVEDIQTVTTESALQNLGTEIKTNIHLTIHELVGANSSQQTTTNNTQLSNKQSISKKITYLQDDHTSADQHRNKNLSQLIRANPTNPNDKS